MNIEFTSEGIKIENNLYPLYSGAFHYWRSERGDWEGILDNILRMGFKIIETYIPWGVHELSYGNFDFGEIDNRKDLAEFLKLCSHKGLLVCVRPGPHINSELSYFGFPPRILSDESIYAKSPWGTPVIYPYFTKQFPIPSYASKKFYSELEVYFDKVADIIKNYVYPKGPVIAIQIDNETNYFFRDKAYILDYCEDSIEMYHKMLEEKYNAVHNLNIVYGTGYQSFKDIEPPKGFKGKNKEDLPYYFDWVEYKEYQVEYALKKISDMWKNRDIHIPTYHNVAFQYYTPIDLIKMEGSGAVDVAGIDMYLTPYEHGEIRRKVRYLSGSSKLPFIPEFLSGVWFDNPRTPLPKEQEFITLYAFMNGLKAINFYMLVERERWQGCPITSDNRIREEYFSLYQNLNKFLNKEKFYDFNRKTNILLMRNYDISRFKSLYSILDLSIIGSNTFFREMEIPSKLFRPNINVGIRGIDSDYEHWVEEPWMDTIESILVKNNVDYNVSDTHLDIIRMKEYEYIFVSSCDFMSEAEQQKLVDYAEQGGNIIIGPILPILNREMKNCSILLNTAEKINEASNKGGSIRVLSDTNLFDINDINTTNEYKVDNKNIELVKFVDKNNRQLLFIANVSDLPQIAGITTNGEINLVSIWAKAENVGPISDKGIFEIKLEPFSVTIWEVK